MNRTLAMLCLTIVILVVGACSSASASASASAPPAATLPGSVWTVASVGGTFVDAKAPPTMDFAADGTISGTTGCNQYNGPYELDGSTITIGLLATTLMLCDGAIGTQETAFSAALQGATTWAIDSSGTLTLSGAGDIVANPSS
jgi:heat shock protein HslJ